MIYSVFSIGILIIFFTRVLTWIYKTLTFTRVKLAAGFNSHLCKHLLGHWYFFNIYHINNKTTFVEHKILTFLERLSFGLNLSWSELKIIRVQKLGVNSKSGKQLTMVIFYPRYQLLQFFFFKFKHSY